MAVPYSRGGEGNDRHIDPRVCGRITKDEIKEPLKKMTNGKQRVWIKFRWKFGSVWGKQV